jgi:hypothetical protein
VAAILSSARPLVPCTKEPPHLSLVAMPGVLGAPDGSSGVRTSAVTNRSPRIPSMQDPRRLDVMQHHVGGNQSSTGIVVNR